MQTQNGTATEANKSETDQLRELFVKREKPNRKRKAKSKRWNWRDWKPIKPSREEVEQWARNAVCFGDGESQGALITLLHVITESEEPHSIALFARNAALAGCDAIIDDVIRQAVANQLSPVVSNK